MIDKKDFLLFRPFFPRSFWVFTHFLPGFLSSPYSLPELLSNLFSLLYLVISGSTRTLALSQLLISNAWTSSLSQQANLIELGIIFNIYIKLTLLINDDSKGRRVTPTLLMIYTAQFTVLTNDRCMTEKKACVFPTYFVKQEYESYIFLCSIRCQLWISCA